MNLLTKETRKRLPPLYATEPVPVEDKVIQVEFFTPWTYWTWYGVEFDSEDLFFGLVQGDCEEWGYFSLKELAEICGPYGSKVERDRYFTPALARTVMGEGVRA